MRRKQHVFMAEDGGAAAGGAGAGGTGSEGGAADAGTGSNTESGTASGVPAGSALASGAASGAGVENGDFGFIPEKYHVKKEDGTFDLDASARKLAEAHASAEKRIGSGDIPPKSAEEYAVTVPDAFKEAWKPEEDQAFADFRKAAFEAGYTQKQFDLAMSSYFNLAPQLVAGAQTLDNDACMAELGKIWNGDAAIKENIRHSYTGVKAAAEAAGMNIDEIMAPTALGNNPMFIRLMAAIGPEYAEDKVPGGISVAAQETIDTLLRSEAYTNSKHPDHEKVSAQIRAYYEKKHGKATVL